MFAQLHPSDALTTLPQEACLGLVDPATLPEDLDAPDEDELRRQAAREEMPSPKNMLLLADFETWAQRVLSNTAWAYYRSAADEERSTRLYYSLNFTFSCRLMFQQLSRRTAMLSGDISFAHGYYAVI